MNEWMNYYNCNSRPSSYLQALANGQLAMAMKKKKMKQPKKWNDNASTWRISRTNTTPTLNKENHVYEKRNTIPVSETLQGRDIAGIVINHVDTIL